MIELTPNFVERYATADSRGKRELSRLMTPGQKMEMGGLLFDRERDMIECLIRNRFPDATDLIVRDLVGAAVRMLYDDD